MTDNKERYINPYTDESKKIFWDNYSVMKTATDKGHAKGLAEGLELGRAEGRAEERIVNARNLKRNGVPVDIIVKSIGLTEEEIDQL